MSDAYRNVEDILETLNDTIREKHNDILSEIESDLEELDEYRNLFDDADEARDCKDYRDELSDIFDDAYDAQQAKYLADACEWQGWDDPSEIEEAAGELERYRDLGDFEDVQEAVHNSGSERIAELEKQVEMLEAQVNRGIELENQRIEAITVLGGIDKTQADIDLRAGTEIAYESGLSDGLLVQGEIAKSGVDLDFGEQGAVDPDSLDDEA